VIGKYGTIYPAVSFWTLTPEKRILRDSFNHPGNFVPKSHAQSAFLGFVVHGRFIKLIPSF
jgi:hypothetical protein